jgi:hypothetical protein
MQKIAGNKIAAGCCFLIAVLALLSMVMKSAALICYVAITVLLIVASSFAISAYQQRGKNTTR